MLAVVSRRIAIIRRRSTDIVWRDAILDSVDQLKQHIVLGLRVQVGIAGLANVDGGVAAAAVAHAADGEEAVELVEFRGRRAHVGAHGAPVVLGVVGADDGVGGAVVGEELAAAVAEGRQVAVEGLQVGRVLGQRRLGVLGRPRARVSVRVLLDDVLVVGLGHGEGGPAEVDAECVGLGAGVEARVV